jgi:hypothetical protein
MASSKKEEREDRQGEHSALVAAEAVAKNAKSTKDREEAAENVIILETTPTTKTSPSSQKTQWLEQQQFVVKIDHKDVDYKQVANNINARILGIDFSKGDRIIEITGTQMRP